MGTTGALETHDHQEIPVYRRHHRDLAHWWQRRPEDGVQTLLSAQRKDQGPDYKDR